MYFLAGYYGIMEVLVDEIKRLTDGCASMSFSGNPREKRKRRGGARELQFGGCPFGFPLTKVNKNEPESYPQKAHPSGMEFERGMRAADWPFKWMLAAPLNLLQLLHPQFGQWVQLQSVWGGLGI